MKTRASESWGGERGDKKSENKITGSDNVDARIGSFTVDNAAVPSLANGPLTLRHRRRALPLPLLELFRGSLPPEPGGCNAREWIKKSKDSVLSRL